MSPVETILTERDHALISDIYKYRYLSVSQIEKLHFPSKRTAYRRLSVLGDGGYLQNFTVPNIPERIYCLARKGADLVASSLGVTITELQWSATTRAPKDYYFLRHFLEVNDFRIVLTSGCREASIDLVGYIPEYFGTRTAQGGLKKYIKDVVCDIQTPTYEISHTPDAVFALAKNGKPALFFLEIDRGTEVVSDAEKGVLKSFRFYVNCLLREQYHRYEKDFHTGPFKGFRALVITTSQERVDNMRRACSQLNVAQKAKQFIWLTTENSITSQSIFQAIWQSSDIEDMKTYSLS
jgi:hypothetical protein